VYDGPGLNRFRLQHSGVAARDGQWEVHYDPYDVSRIWVRDHWDGGWITVFWTQLHRVAAPFGELAWDHARKQMPHASETELADAVEDLLTRAGQGPDDPDRQLSTRDRRVAARTAAVRGSLADPGPPGMAENRYEPEDEAGDQAGDQAGAGTRIVPMPIFDPFREAEKWR
jgi:putative transposase